MVPLSVKGGAIVHVGNNAVLLDRLQTGGPGSVNIKRDMVYELGNYKSVGAISDIPDLSFTMESFDVSCAMEALLLDVDLKETHSFVLESAKVLNVKSAFKPGQNAPSEFDTVGSAAVPCLHLESVSYKYGIGNANAAQTATLKGDSLYYNPGSAYIDSAAGTGTAGQTIVTAHPAYAITEGGVDRRTLAITAGDKRLLIGVDYTETYGTITAGAAVATITILAAVASTDTIYVTYASPDVESFPQSVHALVSGISGTLTTPATAAGSTIRTDVELTAGDSVILDDVPGSVVTEVVTVDTVAAPTTLGTVAIAITSGVLTISAPESLIVGDQVTLGTVTNGAPLVTGGTYFVKTAPSSTTLTLSLTSGGTTIATTQAGTATSIVQRGWVTTLVDPLVNSHATAVEVAVYVPTVKPAAIRGRDIDIYIGPAGAAGSAPEDVIGTKRHGVQSASADWKVTLQNDEEMGNYHYVNIDFDVPVVSGSLAFKPQTFADLLSLAQDLSGVSDPLKSANPTDAPLQDVQVALKNPIDGRVLKRLHIPDARFSLPGYSAKVQSKLDFTAAYTSDRGELHVYDY